MRHPRTHLRRDRWSNLENEIQRETRIVLLWRVFAGDIRHIDLEAIVFQTDAEGRGLQFAVAVPRIAGAQREKSLILACGEPVFVLTAKMQIHLL